MFLEWSTELTRDRLASVPIINFLKLNNVSVYQYPFQNAFWSIDVVKPDIVVLMNTNGSLTSIDVARYAKNKGCVVISLFGEGNFQEERIEQFFFGHNKVYKEVLDDYRLVWSQRAKNLVDKHYQSRSSTTIFCGSTGADNYILASKLDNNIFDKYQRKKEDYELVLGIGCWDFGLLSEKDHRHEFVKNNISVLEQKRILNDGTLFNKTLTQLVEHFSDILFLVKEHPHKSKAVSDPSMIHGLDKYNNVVVLDQDESITDCIIASDIWLSYESTTAMEAWIAGLSTGLLNPSGVNFESKWRASVCTGQPNFQNFNEWKHAINFYKKFGKLPSEDDYELIRKSILEDVFGYIDGLNHVRVGNFILKKAEEINGNNIKTSTSLKSIIKLVIWKTSKKIKGFGLKGVFELLPSSFNIRPWDDFKAKSYENHIMEKQKELYSRSKMTIESLKVLK